MIQLLNQDMKKYRFNLNDSRRGLVYGGLIGFFVYLAITLYLGMQTVTTVVVTSLIVGILVLLLLPGLRKDNPN